MTAPIVQDLVTIPRETAGLPNLIGQSRDDLSRLLGDIGVPDKQVKMRVSQIWQWLYRKGARHFDEMTNLSKDIRGRLAERAVIARPDSLNIIGAGSFDSRQTVTIGRSTSAA